MRSSPAFRRAVDLDRGRSAAAAYSLGRPVGGLRDPAAVDHEHRAVVEAERRDHLEARAALERAVAHDDLFVGEVLARERDDLPALVDVERRGVGQRLGDGDRVGVVVRVDAGDLGERLGAPVQLPRAERAARDGEDHGEGEVARPPRRERKRHSLTGRSRRGIRRRRRRRRTPRPRRGTIAPRGSRAGTRRARRTRATSCSGRPCGCADCASRCARSAGSRHSAREQVPCAAAAPMPPITRHRARRRTAVGRVGSSASASGRMPIGAVATRHRDPASAGVRGHDRTPVAARRLSPRRARHVREHHRDVGEEDGAGREHREPPALRRRAWRRCTARGSTW